MPVVAFILLFWSYLMLIVVRLYLKRPELFQSAGVPGIASLQC